MGNVLRPEGLPVMIAGEEHKLLFTLSAIADIEEHFDAPIAEVINTMMADKRKVYPTLQYIITAMVNDEIENKNYITGDDAPTYTLEEMGWNIEIRQTGELFADILTAYGMDFPKREEGEDPNLTRSPRKSTSRGSSTSAQRSSASASPKSGE